MAAANVRNPRWNGVMDKRAKPLCFRCGICGKELGGATKINDHELVCLSQFEASVIVKLVAKCGRRESCLEIRLICRFGIEHRCNSGKDVAGDARKKKKKLGLLKNKVSYEDILETIASGKL